jgi:hypothetical protein
MPAVARSLHRDILGEIQVLTKQFDEAWALRVRLSVRFLLRLASLLASKDKSRASYT